jgi:hypothetical protein
MQTLNRKTKELVKEILIIGVACGEGVNNLRYDDKKDKIKGIIDNLTNRQIEITKQTAIDFANWLEKLSPSQKTSVWSKDGQYSGLFTMDNEQLFEKFEKQYTEPCNGNCGMNYCDDNGCLENKPKSEGEDAAVVPAFV